MRFTQEHHFKSATEMWRVFKDLPEAAENTLLVAERCNLTLPKGGNLLPTFQVPEERTTEEYFRDVSGRGFEERSPAWRALQREGRLRVPWEEYRRRLESEMRASLEKFRALVLPLVVTSRRPAAPRAAALRRESSARR